MKRKQKLVKSKQKLMEQAIAQETGFTDLVPWVKEVPGWTDEQKETKARREIYCLLIRKLILQARRDFRQNQLSTGKYYNSILEWSAVLSSDRRCRNHDENHTHQWECGPCFECLGTGRTLLLFTSRKRGVKCIACNGSGIRSQEFEQSDFLIGDDLEGHLLELDGYQSQPAIDFISASSRGVHADDIEIDNDIDLYELSWEIMEEDEAAEIARQKEKPILSWHEILDLDDEDHLDLYLHLLSLEDELLDENDIPDFQ